MNKPTYKELLDAGVHFGHLKKKWNPKMSPYIFMEHRGIHIIDLNRTSECLDRAANAMRQLAKSGKKIMFVATKKQARDIVSTAARSVGMPFVTERWLGGMMTNFNTVRRSVKKMQNIERMLGDGSLKAVSDLSDAKKKDLNIKGGVEVTGLGDGPLARAGIRPGDVIIRVADADITGVKQFEALVKGLDANKAVPVFIRRADSTLVVPVRPK